MKVLKIIGIVLAVLLSVAVVYTCFACVCKAFDLLPAFTEWSQLNIFDKLGLTFYGKI